MKNIIKIPVFPLNGAIFFPGTNLPLNIFEDRYIDMVDYSFSKQKQIGMIQEKNDGELYNIGCVGKITSFSETEDNRYIINLRGYDFFHVEKEVSSDHKFRILNVSIIKQSSESFNKNKFARDALLKKFYNFIGENAARIDYKIIEEVEDVDLIKFIAMTCPFTTTEKQMLLESLNLNDLSNNLISLFDYYSNINNSTSSIN